MDSLLTQFVDDWRAGPPPEPDTPDAPDYLFGNQRALKRVPTPPTEEQNAWPLDIFRQSLSKIVREYMLTPDPDYMLLIPAPPGAGKTWIGVDLAHWVYEKTTRRVLYAGPRHDFYGDIIEASSKQGHDTAQWREWLPRQRDDQNDSRHTCNYADEIHLWLNKNYDGMTFCQQACGWDYINNGCPYHKQKNHAEPLIYGQHAHVVMGHPLAGQFAVVVGDELPMSTFVHEWKVAAKHIHWAGLPIDEPMTAILFELQTLARKGARLHGPDLIRALGADAVIKACNEWSMPVDADVLAPTVRRSNVKADTEQAPVNFLPTLVPMLLAEATACHAEEDYLHRLWIDSDGLTMLTRRQPDSKLPAHLIWFDATGTLEIYATLFGRKVRTVRATPQLAGRIYQITDRANGKSSLLTYDEEAKEHKSTTKVDQLKAQIERICDKEKATSPAVITYLDLVDQLDRPAAHFYGSRGSNQFQHCDVLIVAGTPQPPLYQIEKLAKALWPTRMRPFDTRWYAVDRTYNYIDEEGNGWAYPISIFADHELTDLLWQYREAEIIQAAHRARILFRDVPVYLLTNIPIAQLPPTKLLSIQDLMGAPQGVNAFAWPEVVAYAEEMQEVATKDLQERFGLDSRTARKYVTLLAEQPGWEPRAVKGGRGRPQTAAGRVE